MYSGNIDSMRLPTAAEKIGYHNNSEATLILFIERKKKCRDYPGWGLYHFRDEVNWKRFDSKVGNCTAKTGFYSCLGPTRIVHLYLCLRCIVMPNLSETRSSKHGQPLTTFGEVCEVWSAFSILSVVGLVWKLFRTKLYSTLQNWTPQMPCLKGHFSQS